MCRSLRRVVCFAAAAIVATACVVGAEGAKVEGGSAVVRPDSFTTPESNGTYIIRIRDHRFCPALLVVPAKQKIKLCIENLDSSAEEFESYDLNREKIVIGGRKITVFIGPLKPGAYSFFGEFHRKTALGVIVAR